VVASLCDFAHLFADARSAARQGAAVLEIRADCFPKSQLRPEPLRGLLAKVRTAARRPLLLTLRSRAEGGKLPRRFPEQDRLRLFRAALSEVSAVDVELSAEDIARHVVFEAHKRGRAAVVSYHNFRKTPSPSVLRGIVRQARRFAADILKVAVTAKTAGDAERLKEFSRNAGFPRRVFIAMGPKGVDSRVNGARWGSCLTYGYVRRPAAPGQLSVRELAEFTK
jgi:3-dehydroquinate dehydratase I